MVWWIPDDGVIQKMVAECVPEDARWQCVIQKMAAGCVPEDTRLQGVFQKTLGGRVCSRRH